jgi:hypothetical protein
LRPLLVFAASALLCFTLLYWRASAASVCGRKARRHYLGDSRRADLKKQTLARLLAYADVCARRLTYAHVRIT